MILLTESIPAEADSYVPIAADVFDLKVIYTWVLKHKKKFFYVLCKDAKAFIKQVTKSVVLIEAAGGLVKNEKKASLFIYRNGKWDLPKGKIEKGEKVKQAAVREVEEECGITVNKLGEKICKTYHVYILQGNVVLKKTHWFKMRSKSQNKLKPQKEEGITDVRWFKKDNVALIVNNTFPSIIDVLVKENLIKDKEAPLSV